MSARHGAFTRKAKDEQNSRGIKKRRKRFPLIVTETIVIPIMRTSASRSLS